MFAFCWIRRISTSSQHLKSVKFKKVKGASSHDWLQRQLTDPYVEKARMMNYRCRSAFKLIEIDDKYRILQPGGVVIDCGAAPGSWSQVAVARVAPEGVVVSIDKQQIFPIPGVAVLGNLDFTSSEAQARILEALNGHKPTCVLSDMAPKATGVRDLDTENIISLCYAVLRFAVQISEVGASLVVKLWQCGQTKQLETDMSRFYGSVKNVKPSSSRTDSAEMFLLGRGFKGLIKV